jgi:hypothetical protein
VRVAIRGQRHVPIFSKCSQRVWGPRPPEQMEASKSQVIRMASLHITQNEGLHEPAISDTHNGECEVLGFNLQADGAH